MYVLIYDYLGSHGDFLRFIFVRAIEKLYWQANFGISRVSLSLYILYINKLICRSVFKVLNSKLERNYNR